MRSTETIPARLDRVSKRYGGAVALDGVAVDIRAGELLALLGPNGAGKTTAIGLLLGLHQPDAGGVELFGQAPQTLAARREVGVMLQSAGIPDTLKVRELLELTRSYYAEPRSIADCVALAGLDGLLERLYGRLSGGQQRRVQFALALCGRPRLLFLDEPTTGLDIEARMGLWKAIRELVGQGCAVLLTTHYLEEAEALADRVVVLNRGRIVAEGSVAQIRAQVDRRLIRCVSRLTAAAVAAWPGVVAATAVAGRLEIVVADPEPIVRRLLNEDPELRELEVQRAGLAEAFVELTREAA
ncbi:ABC transporter ATP-binding protein [Dokdonella koreensis]|uniref:ABC transporter, ATP-binding protein n=1 Tax=Dokdonella koreensis DS-123 TaxID=1300342 RepID=A0A160DWY1_9GAMM|nr:ABC transporter ATP-binding protein [Dokdonella koreensis]ANB19185.1 ABC transporter, ATP-binding protein [Dokdonella koreensis DS-123]